MSQIRAMDASRVINGSYGECWCEGEWQTNINKVTAEVELTKEEVKRSGTRWTGHKLTAIKGTGTISGYHVTSAMHQRAAAPALDDRAVNYITEIITKLDDPEAYGYERVRLCNVTFDKIQLANFEAQALVEDEMPFTFEGLEWLDAIEA